MFGDHVTEESETFVSLAPDLVKDPTNRGTGGSMDLFPYFMPYSRFSCLLRLSPEDFLFLFCAFYWKHLSHIGDRVFEI